MGKPIFFDGGTDDTRLNSQDMRQAIGSLLTAEPTDRSPLLGLRAGVLVGVGDNAGVPNAGKASNTNPASGKVAIQPFRSVIPSSRSGASGAFIGGGPDDQTNVDVLGGDGVAQAMPRTDRIVARVYTSEAGDGRTEQVLEVVRGVAATDAPVPDLPADAIPICRVFVDANVTQITGAAITDERIFTVPAGGILPVRSLAEYPDDPYTGQTIDHPAAGGLLRFDGTRWTRTGVLGSYVSKNVPDTGAITTIGSVATSLVAGRWYRIELDANATHITAASTVSRVSVVPSGAAQSVPTLHAFYEPGSPAQPLVGTVVRTFKATATGAATFAVAAGRVGGGALRIDDGAIALTISDAGL